MPSGPALGWPEQSITRIGTETADDVAHGFDPRFRCRDLFNIYSCFRAELARQL